MSFTNSPLLGLIEPVTGTESGVWGDDVNLGLTTYVDLAIAGTNNITTDANVTLVITTGTYAGSGVTTNTAQYAILNCTGARTALRYINAPNSSKIYNVINNTTGGFNIVVRGSTGPTAGVTILNGERCIIAWDTVAADYVKMASDTVVGLIGTLPVTNGGTGATTLSGLVYGNGTATMTAATAAQVVAVIGSTPVNTATTATNIAGGAANQIAYQSGSGATTFATAPSTAGYVLGWNGTSFTWVAAPAATTANNLTGGGANTVVYQSSTGVTAYITNGTTGQVLTANTSGAPAWSTINALPSQTGNAGKFLTTDGTNASWSFTGASAGGVIWENSTNISSNYTLTTSKNGLSVGPITIASGVSVTVPSGQRWVVL
jgi:hypothetical protein